MHLQAHVLFALADTSGPPPARNSIKQTGRHIFSKRINCTFVDNKDVFAVLPTGFAKSFI